LPLPLKEIERPLGQVRSPEPRNGRRLVASRRTVGDVVIAVLLLAASSAIAFRERPFHRPVVVAAETSVEATPAAQGSAVAQAAPASISGDSAGPSIIHVNPADQGSRTGTVIVRDPSAIGQNLRVAHLPDRALIEQSETGPLPIRAADGRRPVDVYARPWSGARGARVAIVIGGLGVSQTGTQQAIEKLPAEVTLAFAPQGNSIGRWMQAARRQGHEIIMQVPLEPFDYPTVNPGRNTLTVEASPDENIANLHWTLSRTTNYTGVTNYMGALFSADRAAMAPVMAELGKRGLLYLDDGTSARSVAAELALKSGVPFAEGDATIDAVHDRGEVLKKLDELERTARAKGFAIGTGSAFDLTVDAVARWVNEARKRGIEIVPVSAVASDPERG
jgi:polysaccharide deacetylase 2 family uncharacterized protein YibQ